VQPHLVFVLALFCVLFSKGLYRLSFNLFPKVRLVMTRLRTIVSAAGSPASICRAAFSASGRYLVSIVGPWRELELARLTGNGVVRRSVPRAHNLTVAVTRDFLDDDGRVATELLYAGDDSGKVQRYSLQCRRQVAPLPSRIEAGELYSIKTSSDGRYVALGSTGGVVEVWNLDLDQPHLVFDAWLCDMGNIVDITFSASNCELYICGSQGGIVRLEVLGQGAARLDSECSWNCFSIAAQPAGGGMAFAGDGNKVWLLNVENAQAVCMSDSVPFAFEVGDTVTGAPYWYLPGFLKSRLGCIDTFAGGLIQQLRFLDQDTLAVLGESGVEVFDLPSGKRQLRQPHSKDRRMPALGGRAKTALVLECL